MRRRAARRAQTLAELGMSLAAGAVLIGALVVFWAASANVFGTAASADMVAVDLAAALETLRADLRDAEAATFSVPYGTLLSFRKKSDSLVWSYYLAGGTLWRTQGTAPSGGGPVAWGLAVATLTYSGGWVQVRLEAPAGAQTAVAVGAARPRN